MRAMQDCKLPPFHGKLLHGALFALMKQYSPQLADFVHDEMTIKPFTVSQLLEFNDCSNRHTMPRIKANDFFSWRVSFLREELADFFMGMPLGMPIKVGRSLFRIERIIADGTQGTGVLDEMELVSGALNTGWIQKITFDYLSPTTFRENTHHFLLPLPEMVFGSLADKWSSLEMPGPLDSKKVRQLAAGINIIEWHGESVIVPINKSFSISGFKGNFVYDISDLEEEQRKIMILLAQYANIAGVGRMSGQGFGYVRVTFN